MIDLPNPFDFNSSANLPRTDESGAAQPDAPYAAPVVNSVSPSEAATSLPSGESDPVVMQDFALGENLYATGHIHEIFFHASRLIADDYRDWALTQADDDLYETLLREDQANTRDLAAPPDYYALLEATELMPLFLRRA